MAVKTTIKRNRAIEIFFVMGKKISLFITLAKHYDMDNLSLFCSVHFFLHKGDIIL